MNTKLFKDAHDVLSECDQMVRDDRNDAINRATIEAFYNGRDTMSEEDAEKQGISQITNHLFGYESIDAAKRNLSSLVTKSPKTWKIQLKNAPLDKKQEWELAIETAFNEVIRDSGRYRPEHEGISGDAVLHGSSFLMWRDAHDWCPTMTRPLVPRSTSASVDALEYACVPDYLTISQLRSYLRLAERRGERSKWNLKGLRDAIDAIEGRFLPGGDPNNQDLRVDHEYNADEMVRDAQAGTSLSDKLRTKLPVYYFYSVRSDEPSKPVDVTLVTRYSPEQIDAANRNQRSLDPLLFDNPRQYKFSRQWMTALFLDCQIGGQPLWYRTMGLGKLNYEADVDTETFFNEAMQGARDHLRRIFSVKDASDSEQLERWLGGDAHSNILPPGVELAQEARATGLGEGLQMMQILMQTNKSRAGSSVSNSLEGQTNELEVQALQRQSQSAQAVAARMNDVYFFMGQSGETMFIRMSRSYIEGQSGWQEKAKFEALMQKAQIPMAFLRKVDRFGKLVNVSVVPNRVAGNGDVVATRIINQQLMARIHLYSPQAQQKILRRITADETQDFELAEDLVPSVSEPDPDQFVMASQEDDAMRARGIAGFVAPLTSKDIHPTHLDNHVNSLQALIEKGRQAGGWDEMDASAYHAIRQHVEAHMQQIHAAGNKQLHKGYSDAVAETDRGQKELINNLQAKREAEQVDPEKQARLEMDREKLELSKRSQASIEADRQTKNELRASEIAGKQAVSDAKQNLDEEKTIADFELQKEQLGRQQAIDEIRDGQREPQGNKNQ